MQNLWDGAGAIADYVKVYPDVFDPNCARLVGVWVRGEDEKILTDGPEIRFLILEAGSGKNSFEKDIMEMWRKWNKEKRINYIFDLLHEVGMDFSNSDLTFRCNRGLATGPQTQEWNHLRVSCSSKGSNIFKEYRDYLLELQRNGL